MGGRPHRYRLNTMPTTIKAADLIESIAAALQYISFYHPADYIAHLARAYELEQGPAAKDAIAQIPVSYTHLTLPTICSV